MYMHAGVFTLLASSLLICRLVKDRNLFPVRSLSPSRWKPNFYFI